MSDPLEYDRHAMVLADLAAITLIDRTLPSAYVAHQIVKAYLWAKQNARPFRGSATMTEYPSLTELREAWPAIIAVTPHD